MAHLTQQRRIRMSEFREYFQEVADWDPERVRPKKVLPDPPPIADAKRTGYTTTLMAADALELMTHLGWQPSATHLVGVSMGGMIAQIISAQYPQKVKSFTLIASTASTPSPMNAPAKPVRELMPERSKNPDASVEDVIKREIKIVSLIGMKGRVVDTPEFREETIQNLNRAQDGSGYARQLLSILASKDRLKKIQKIKAPTLIIHGKHDPMIRLKNAYKMHKLIPHSKLKIIEDMRHLIEPEILRQFESDLLDHLRLAS